MDNSNKNKITQNKIRLLFLKKIKLKKFPELKKNLNDYFWKIEKYFQPRFKNIQIQIGNNYSKKMKIPCSQKRKVERRKTRKFNSPFTSVDQKDSRVTLTHNTSSSRIEIRKVFTKKSKETVPKGLKTGQKYITDFELEDLFNNFRNIQKLNKKKLCNYMTTKEYIDNNSFTINNKSTKNFNIFRDIKNNKSQLNNDNYKILPDLGEGGGSHFLLPKRTKTNSMALNNFASFQNLKEEKDDTNNNICLTTKKNKLNNDINVDDDNKFIKDKKSKTSNNFYKIKKSETNNVISRNILLKKQNQFLLSSKEEEILSPNKIERIKFANLLANQEQTLTNISKNKFKINGLCKTVSKKSHKRKEKLLMTNIDSYRIKNELKDKLHSLNIKIEPEHYYNWKTDLREHSTIIKNNDNINSYNIRDPYNNKTFNLNIPKNNLSKKLNIKFYKKIFDEANKINNNFEGLYIKGKNLLQTEYEINKSLKSKKIINNYEVYLPTVDYEDILFTDKKYFNRNNVKLKINKELIK